MANTVLVTGTSTGFGMEIALFLAEQGFKVYASLRDMSRRMELDAAAARRGVNLRVIQLDVTDQASIETAVQTIIDESGTIEGLVNNAGAFLRGYFEDLSEKEIRDLFDTNLFGTMAVTRAVLPHMRAAKNGRIVIISSVAGKIGAPSGSAYAASRFAQEGFAESLYQEVKPLGIHVSLVESGISKTETWTIDKGVAERAKDPNGPYYAWFLRAEQSFDQRLRRSPITSRHVAESVHKALTDARPRLRYIVGWLPRLIIGVRRYSPGELFERIYFREVMRRLTTQ
jgi:NAD(P)-dependent dehydrogenase (short-subunit alcohol dehydrogenase family)